MQERHGQRHGGRRLRFLRLEVGLCRRKLALPGVALGALVFDLIQLDRDGVVGGFIDGVGFLCLVQACFGIEDTAPAQYARPASTGAPGTPGIDGAIMRRDPGMPAVVNTIDVTALDDMIAMVKANGGTVVAPKMTIPHVGYFVYCQDTEGNTFGMMQNDPSAA
jgi:predicted enzyme related to lactoylglutathione lyase